VHRHPARLSADDRDLAGVDAGAHVDAEVADRRVPSAAAAITALARTVRRARGSRPEGRELAPAKAVDHRPDALVVLATTRVHFASPTRASIAVESQMSENTIVAQHALVRGSVGDFANAVSARELDDSHGRSPSTHARCPGGIS
jgi:hypothetical protein